MTTTLSLQHAFYVTAKLKTCLSNCFPRYIPWSTTLSMRSNPSVQRYSRSIQTIVSSRYIRPSLSYPLDYHHRHRYPTSLLRKYPLNASSHNRFKTTISDGTNLSSESSSSSSQQKKSLADDESRSDHEELVAGPMENPEYHKATIWFENVFPFKWSILDPRTYWIRRYAEDYLETEQWKSLLPAKFPEGADFVFLGAEPNFKEGGLYMKFKYRGGTVEEAVEAIQKYLLNNGTLSYFNFQRINAFQVKGRPWIEDMVSRVPTARLHVDFDGPPLSVETLYREFRFFGRIVDISLQPTTPKDPPPRYASVEFLRKRPATSARNCIHGESIDGTRLSIGYEKQSSRWRSFWNWITSNLRLSVPIILGIAAAISYLVFDPLRVIFITNKITGRFSLEKYYSDAGELAKRLLNLASSFFFTPKMTRPLGKKTEGWSEREAEEKRLATCLWQTPETLILVTGPKGSGKTDMVVHAIQNRKFKLVIHCNELVGKSDTMLLSRLAYQVNFFPAFGFLSQASAFMDALITATTGAKAGLSTTREAEIRKILDCVTLSVTKLIEEQQIQREKALRHLRHAKESDDTKVTKESLESIPEIEYPVIVIEDFLSKYNARGQFLYDILVEWAGALAEYKLAHIVFVSDNRAAARMVGKALPAKSFELFQLSDATPESSLEYVKKRLPNDFPVHEVKPCLDILGGRLNDLEILIQKIHADACRDMLNRAMSELRKIGLGLEDGDSSPNVNWSSTQFWRLMELLSLKESVPFDAVVMEPLFKGDGSPLQAMERADLIAIEHFHGKPHCIRPSKPLYKSAFVEMTTDPVFSAAMGILTVKQLITEETKKIREFEDELNSLSVIRRDQIMAEGYLGSLAFHLNQLWSGWVLWPLQGFVSLASPIFGTEITPLLGSNTFASSRATLESRIRFLTKKLESSASKVSHWNDQEAKFRKRLKV